MNERALHEATAVDLRLAHAKYFIDQYFKHSGPPSDSYSHMIAYFDAYLFFLASVFDLSDESTKSKLKSKDEFLFAKILRNISTHRSVLAAPGSKGEYIRPMMRVIGASVGPENSSSKLYFNLLLLEEVLNKYASARTSETKSVEASMRYVQNIKGRKLNPELGELMLEILDTVKTVTDGT